MIRVAIETATRFGTVAVGRDDLVLAEVGMGVQTRHAEAVLPAIETALSLAGEARSAIQEVVVGAGPGSFTGVRVAAATAKGLVAALDVPLLAYPSLLALAAATPCDGAVCALFDARRGEVYAGCWRWGASGPVALVPPMVGPVAAAVDAVVRSAPDGVPTTFTGDGVARYRETLLSLLSPAATAAATAAASAGADHGPRPGPLHFAAVTAYPRASTLLWLAEHHRSGAEVRDVAKWQPLYVRGSSAERGVAG